MVWYEGLEEWKNANEIDELRDLMSSRLKKIAIQIWIETKKTSERRVDRDVFGKFQNLWDESYSTAQL